ncbi:glycosyltransferase [Nakamurella sp.]|uniref:glycosyltransferase n=1 Tax=Nakamurella sp. TaxID=1869182 RepID=UPI003B3B8554
MRIAMVSEHASPLATLGGVDAGGQNVHVAALARTLAADGHAVTVYTRRDGTTVPEVVTMPGGVQVVQVPAGPPEPIPKDEMLPFMGRFGDWMADHWRRTGPPDVVHAHFWMSGLAALRAGGALGVPVAQTYHALGVTKRRHQGEKDTSPSGRVQFEQFIGRRADLIIATCTDEVRELTGMGVDPVTVTVVPCGVDLDLFRPGAPSAPRPGTGPFRLLCLGRLVERKGVDTVLRALALVPDAHLVVAGGPPADGLPTDPEAVRLAALATELAVGDRVRFIGGLDHRAVPGQVRAADVVVCTPWYEPFGIVPLEAAGCGRPVVGSAVGGLLDTVEDGMTGLLVPPRDPESLAAAQLRQRGDPARRAPLGRAARPRAEERYGWPTVGRATLAAYRTVVVRPSRRRDPAVTV